MNEVDVLDLASPMAAEFDVSDAYPMFDRALVGDESFEDEFDNAPTNVLTE